MEERGKGVMLRSVVRMNICLATCHTGQWGHMGDQVVHICYRGNEESEYMLTSQLDPGPRDCRPIFHTHL